MRPGSFFTSWYPDTSARGAKGSRAQQMLLGYLRLPYNNHYFKNEGICAFQARVPASRSNPSSHTWVLPHIFLSTRVILVHFEFFRLLSFHILHLNEIQQCSSPALCPTQSAPLLRLKLAKLILPPKLQKLATKKERSSSHPPPPKITTTEKRSKKLVTHRGNV
ncbi:hypothetical protein BDZ45DRAFT_426333 [Acephala macrosclerotiorum]|nr:hypothetical protein BDZ45DRAFT_426333 [Acephala macrosclerotiorum]